MEKIENFLRPEYTRLIIDRLNKGDSLNLYGEPGIGKTRLLEDIKNAGFEDVCVILVSFTGYEESYKGLCQGVWNDADIAGECPETLSAVIDKIKAEKKRIFLFIDECDKLRANNELDEMYNMDFIGTLNSIKNYHSVSLCLVSEAPLDNFPFYIENKIRPSILKLKTIPIDRLRHKDIERESQRLFKYPSLNEHEMRILVSHLNNKDMNYSRLEYYEAKISCGADCECEISGRLSKWDKGFNKDNKDGFSKRVVKLNKRIKRSQMYFNYPCLYNFLIKVVGKVLKATGS